jgi:hypothetical protein
MEVSNSQRVIYAMTKEDQSGRSLTHEFYLSDIGRLEDARLNNLLAFLCANNLDGLWFSDPSDNAKYTIGRVVYKSKGCIPVGSRS